MKYSLAFLIFSLVLQHALNAFIDLEEHLSDFILEEKQLEIPEYPFPFNPSIVQWQNKILLSFRTRDPLTQSTNPIGLVWLDQDFQALHPPQILHLELNHALFPSKAQDPRLIVVNDELYMVYNNIIESPHGEIRRMHIAKMVYDGGKFQLESPQCLIKYPEENPRRHEKNWTPFAWQNYLLLIYSVNPHRILFTVPHSDQCVELAVTSKKIRWDLGELRGGTTALLEGDEYLTFFHSCIEMASEQSERKKMTHYFMGAYTFNSEPPFEVLRVSSDPIIGKTFYSGPAHKTWKPLRVVFPCGFIKDEKYIWVVYGRQDFESWVVKLDKRGLLDSLKEVSKPESEE